MSKPEIEQTQYELGNPLLREILPDFVYVEVYTLADYHDQDNRDVDEIPVLFATFEGCSQDHCDYLKRFKIYNGKSHRIFRIHLGGSAYWMVCDNHYMRLEEIRQRFYPIRAQFQNECWVIRHPEWDEQFWEVYKITIRPQEEMAEECPDL
jgi:hypothetical protein